MGRHQFGSNLAAGGPIADHEHTPRWELRRPAIGHGSQLDHVWCELLRKRRHHRLLERIFPSKKR